MTMTNDLKFEKELTSNLTDLTQALENLKKYAL